MTALHSMDLDRLKVMARLTQMDADEHQRHYRKQERGHPGRVRASQLQSEAAMLRREIRRRHRSAKATDCSTGAVDRNPG